MNMINTVSTAVTASVVEITPQLASTLLKTSKGNRSLKAAKILSLVRDMESNRFTLNGESIIISSQGNLMDGHHRLSACVKSGVTIQSVVVNGVAPSDGKTQDTGASRTIGDHLALSGYKNGNNLSAIISCLMSLANDRPRSANPSSTEVYKFIQEYPEIEAAASFAATKAYPRAGNILGAIYFVADRMGEVEKAVAFRDVFASGVPAYDGCPAHLLRERLNKQAMKGEKLPVATTHKLFVAAWEKFRSAKAAKTLKAPSGYKITGWPDATHY